jgi:N-acetylmuramoyl-L-alanine amidase
VPRAVVTPTDVVLAVESVTDDGRHVAVAPCGGTVIVTGTPLSGATVVVDPGHGGDEPGAVGPAGTLEKDVNLAVAEELERQLEDAGAVVVLTRTADYRITLASRRAIANALRPGLFLSIHHNADPDGPHDGPGAETYFQVASSESKRAAGLVYETMLQAFSGEDIAWVGDTDAGAKYRIRDDGTDYYGILRGVDVPAVLSEAAFISNPAEEALLATREFQEVEAQALASAIGRFLLTDDPGSGYVDPYPRTEPAGPGGGPDGCVDPPLG